MPHEEGHPLFGVRRDVSREDLLDDPRLWRALFEQSFGLPTSNLSRQESLVSGRFEDVRSNFLLKEAANVAGLQGFGQFTGGRTFAEELALLQPSGTPFGQGFGTGVNLRSIGRLSEEEDALLREQLDLSGVSGVGSESIMNRAIRNAAIAQFGSRIGTGVAARETSGAARDRFEIEELQRDRTGASFTRSILERLRTRFGIGAGLARAG